MLPNLSDYQTFKLLKKLEAEDSLASFIKQGWQYIDPQPYQHGWHVDAICLPYKSKIFTEDGYKSIGEIVETKWCGKVLSYNHGRNVLEWKKIKHWFKNPAAEGVRLTTSTNQLTVTNNHPIYIVGEGYVRADKIKKGWTVSKLSQLPKNIQSNIRHQGNVLLPKVPLRAYKKEDQRRKVYSLQKLWDFILQKSRTDSRWFLLDEMFWEGENSSFKNLYGLWKRKNLGQCIQVQAMLPCGASSTENRQRNTLLPMWQNDISLTSQVGRDFSQAWSFLQLPLFGKICKRKKQSKLYRWSKLRRLSRRISKTAKKNYNKRKKTLFLLFKERQIGCSSYRQKQTQQRSFKFNRLVPGMSWLLSQRSVRELHKISESIIISVERDVWIPNATYNIEVEDNNNYFANDILVHNCEHLEAVSRGYIKRLLINVPPRSSKSSICSVGWPAWTWIQERKNVLTGPQVQFMSTSYASSLSERDSTKMRRLIDSEWYQENWGDRFRLAADQNTKRKFENSAGGYRLATSLTGTQTGDGGIILLVDDPTSANDANSEVERENVLRWWTETRPTRLNDAMNGAIVVIMQRLHQEDLSGHILENDIEGDWTHLMLPMRYDSGTHCHTSIGWEDPRTYDGELLCPSRYGEKQVSDLEHSLGSYATAAQLQQIPAPKGGGIIKESDWRLYPPDDWDYDTDKPLEFPPFEYILASADTAYTEKEENDYSACTVWGIWRDRKNLPRLMLIEAWNERLAFNGLVKRIIDTAIRRKIDCLLLEGKASGLSVYQEIKRLCGNEDFSVYAINPVGDKVTRMHTCQPLFENGTIYAPDRKYVDMVRSQMAQFPKGKHDDLCFVGDTLIATRRGNIKIKDITIGDEVVTPDGFKKVKSVLKNGKKEVIKRFGLTGTPNHPIFSVDSGYQPLHNVSHNLMRLTLCGLMRITLLKTLYSMELPSVEWEAVENITYLNLPQMSEGKILKAYTWQFGNFIRKKQYKKALKLITRMVIPSIMILKTWSVYRCACIVDSLRKTVLRRIGYISKTLGHLHWSGINRKKVKNGIANMPNSLSLNALRIESLRARCAGLFLPVILIQKMFSTVLIIAKLNLVIEKISQLLGPDRLSVLCVEKNLQQKLRLKQNIATATAPKKPFGAKEEVFNLTIEAPSCYFANGILVHNCDSVTQAINYMRKIGLAVLSAEGERDNAINVWQGNNGTVTELYGV